MVRCVVKAMGWCVGRQIAVKFWKVGRPKKNDAGSWKYTRRARSEVKNQAIIVAF